MSATLYSPKKQTAIREDDFICEYPGTGRRPLVASYTGSIGSSDSWANCRSMVLALKASIA